MGRLPHGSSTNPTHLTHFSTFPSLLSTIHMVGTKITPPPTSVTAKAVYYWNPHSPKFYEHLVYGAGKPRCVVPLEALKKAAQEDENFALKSSLDETYHPDEICPAVRQDMAAEAKFMMGGRHTLAEKARKAGQSSNINT